MDQDAPKTMSVPEAGKQLGLGKNGSYAAVARGEIPVLRFGSRLRVPVVALERMLSEGSSNLRMDTVEVGHAISESNAVGRASNSSKRGFVGRGLA